MSRVPIITLLLSLLTAPDCADSLRQSPRTDDPGIANLALHRLAADPRLCPYDITVVVYSGTARLEGKVSDDADKRRAEHLTREAGATRIDDRLVTDPSAGEMSKC